MNPRYVALHVSGEPTLHPKFVEFVEYLNSKYWTLLIGLATNASKLKPEYSHLRNLEFIIYVATSQEELGEKSSMDFDSYAAKIKDYISHWYIHDCDQSIFCILPHHINELENHGTMNAKYDFFSNLLPGEIRTGLDTKSKTFFQYNNKIGRSLVFRTQLIDSGAPYTDTDPNWAYYPYKDRPLGFCDKLWNELTIYCDGSTGTCCADVDARMACTDPGAIWEYTLREIWNTNPKLLNIREQFSVGSIYHDLCKKCLVRYPDNELYCHQNSRENYIHKQES